MLKNVLDSILLGTYPPFGLQDVDNSSKNTPQTVDNDDEDRVIAPQHAELSAYGPSARKSLRVCAPTTFPPPPATKLLTRLSSRPPLSRSSSRSAVAPYLASNRVTTLLRPSPATTGSTSKPTRRPSSSGPPPARPVWAASCLAARRTTMKQPHLFLYKSCKFLFEDFELSVEHTPLRTASQTPLNYLLRN